jgi:hypothetical protein
MMRDSLEKQYLLGLRFGLSILDEAHKARSKQVGIWQYDLGRLGK